VEVINSAVMPKPKKSKKQKAVKKPVAKKKAAAKSRVQKSSGTRKSPLGKKAEIVKRPRSSAGRATQAGDLQGFSRNAGVDYESVDELLEEGNACEAGIVNGVEDSPNADEGEVRTREVEMTCRRSIDKD
jgi:hypothetical protein